jgi:hypothetical protein
VGNDTKITNLVFIPNNSNDILSRFKFRHSTGKIFFGGLLNVPYQEEKQVFIFSINIPSYYGDYATIVFINEKDLQQHVIIRTKKD